MGYKIKSDRADKYFSLYIRTRDNWTCQRCGKAYPEGSQGLHCSHFQGRRKENTRFDPNNCDALDFGCHAYFTANPGEHYAWQVSRKGQDGVDKLILASNLYVKKDRALQEIYWKAQLKADFGVG